MPGNDRTEKLVSLERKHSVSSKLGSLPPRHYSATSTTGSRSAIPTSERMATTRRRSPSPSSSEYGKQRIRASGDKTERASTSSVQGGSSEVVQSFRRNKSTENPMHLEQAGEKPSVRQIISVSGSSATVGEGEAETRRQSRRRAMKGLVHRDLAGADNSKNGKATSLATVLEKMDDSSVPTPRRARSLREEKPRSSSRLKRRSSKASTSSSVPGGQDEDRKESSLPVRRRVVRRSLSSVCPSVASATVASSESSSSGASAASRQSSGKKRSSSLGGRTRPRARGDQAPVTPTRGPPSPCTSDTSLSPPQTQQERVALTAPPVAIGVDSSEDSSAAPKPIVSTSKIKRNSKKPRSKRLIRAGSDSVLRSMDMTGAVTSSPMDRDQPSSASSQELEEEDVPSTSGVPVGRSKTCTPADALRLAQEARDQMKTFAGKPPIELRKKRRGFGFSHLGKSFSLGSRKQITSKLALRKGSHMELPQDGMHRQKGVNPARPTDDSTTRSGTERTASTISTTQSDLSSNSGGYDSLSPVPPSAAPVETNYKNFSTLLSRLRTDFDLPADDDEEEVRRPASMSSLTSHLEITKARIAVGKGLDEADEDSTMVSNMDGASPTKNASERSRSSLSKGRKGREQSSSSEERGVCFGSVSVREYERIVGDNPAVSSGVPIGLGWNYSNYLEVDVDIYESSVRKPGPRSRRDFFLAPQNRMHILREEYGCSPQEITDARESAAEVRYQRQVSIFGETVPPPPPPAQVVLPKASEQPSKCPQKPDYRRARSTASMRLPELPKTDNRWDTSCPAFPAVDATP